MNIIKDIRPVTYLKSGAADLRRPRLRQVRGMSEALCLIYLTDRRRLFMKVVSVLASVLLLTLAIAGCSANQVIPSSAQVLAPQSCKATSEQEIAALFDRWNQSLQTGDPHKVVANYAERSILLPTVSNTPRLTPAEKEDYFHHFLENRPSGKIDRRFIEIGCNSAVDAGLYTFTFAKTGKTVSARYSYTYRWDGKRWLITSHHSSAMPEKQ
jgi:uncharacterized protein (TIGR02246 family)